MNTRRSFGVTVLLVASFSGLHAQESRSMLGGLRQSFARWTGSQEQDPLKIQEICGIFHTMLIDYVMGRNNVTYQQITEFFTRHKALFERGGVFSYGIGGRQSLQDYIKYFDMMNLNQRSYHEAALVLFLDHCVDLLSSIDPLHRMIAHERIRQLTEFLLAQGAHIAFLSAEEGVRSALNDAITLNDPLLVKLIMRSRLATDMSMQAIFNTTLKPAVFRLVNRIGSGQDAAAVHSSLAVLDLLLEDDANREYKVYTDRALMDIMGGVLSIQNNADNDNNWIVIEKLLNYTPDGSVSRNLLGRGIFYNLIGMMGEKVLPPDFNMNNGLRMIKKSVEVGQRMQLFDTQQVDEIFDGYVDFIARNDAWSKEMGRASQPEGYIVVLQVLLASHPSPTALLSAQKKIKEYAAQDPYNIHWQEMEKYIDTVVNQRRAKVVERLGHDIGRNPEMMPDTVTGQAVAVDPFGPEMRAEVARFLTGISAQKPISETDKRAVEDLEAYREQRKAAEQKATLGHEQKERISSRKEREFKESLDVPLPSDDDDAE